jgi:phage terminase small subunit
MPALSNPRQEQFAQLVASGTTATEAYTSVGYAKVGASSSAARLLRNAPIQTRVAELKQAVSQATVTRAAVDRAYVLAGLKENFERAMQHRPVLDAKGKETGIYAYNGQVANRALELIGKELGMFVDRNMDVPWDGDPSKLTDAQLDKVIQYFDRLRATTE